MSYIMMSTSFLPRISTWLIQPLMMTINATPTRTAISYNNCTSIYQFHVEDMILGVSYIVISIQMIVSLQSFARHHDKETHHIPSSSLNTSERRSSSTATSSATPLAPTTAVTKVGEALAEPVTTAPTKTTTKTTTTALPPTTSPQPDHHLLFALIMLLRIVCLLLLVNGITYLVRSGSIMTIPEQHHHQQPKQQQNAYNLLQISQTILKILFCWMHRLHSFVSAIIMWMFCIIANIKKIKSYSLLSFLLHMEQTIHELQEERDMAKRQLVLFMSFLCHEIRNPLFAITSTIEECIQLEMEAQQPQRQSNGEEHDILLTNQQQHQQQSSCTSPSSTVVIRQAPIRSISCSHLSSKSLFKSPLRSSSKDNDDSDKSHHHPKVECDQEGHRRHSRLDHVVSNELSNASTSSSLSFSSSLLSNMQYHTNLMLRLVNDVLDLNQLEHGHLSLEHKLYNLSELMMNVITSTKLQLKSCYSTVKFYSNLIPEKSGDADTSDNTLPVIPTMVYGDSVRILQISYHLLSNACKFTDHGHVRFQVRIIDDINDAMEKEYITSTTTTSKGTSNNNNKNNIKMASTATATTATTKQSDSMHSITATPTTNGSTEATDRGERQISISFRDLMKVDDNIKAIERSSHDEKVMNRNSKHMMMLNHSTTMDRSGIPEILEDSLFLDCSSMSLSSLQKQQQTVHENSHDDDDDETNEKRLSIVDRLYGSSNYFSCEVIEAKDEANRDGANHCNHKSCTSTDPLDDDSSNRYCEEDHETISFSNTTRIQQKVLRLEIEDTGCGLSSERIRQYIMEPYSNKKLSDYRMKGGTGLGLSIITRLIRLLNGTIHVSSIEGKGSTFIVYIPISVVVLTIDENVENTQSLSNAKTFVNMMNQSVLVNEDYDAKTDNVIMLSNKNSSTDTSNDVEHDTDSSRCIAATTNACDNHNHNANDRILSPLRYHDRMKLSSLLPELVHRQSLQDDINRSNSCCRNGSHESSHCSSLMTSSGISSSLKKQQADHNEDKSLMNSKNISISPRDQENSTCISSNHKSDASSKVPDSLSGSESTDAISEDAITTALTMVTTTGPCTLSWTTIPSLVAPTKSSSLLDSISTPSMSSPLLSSAPSVKSSILLSSSKLEPSKSSSSSESYQNKKSQSSTKFCLPSNSAVVLVVDDNDMNRKLLGKMLQHFHLEYDTACNGKEAVEKVLKSRCVTGNRNDPQYSLIWMDLQMPVMDGCEAMYTIRETYNIKTIPIIALTANALEYSKEEAYKAGATDFCTKPILRETFHTKCCQYLLHHKDCKKG